jgi:nitrite reductase/ring-hydroxylating ferredoxin subunit
MNPFDWQKHPHRPAAGTRLCQLSDIPEVGGHEVSFGPADQALRIVLLRHDGGCKAYLNLCPHFSLPLNFQPQTFVIFEDTIVCAHHTALFRIADGACVDGPCGQTGLTPVAVHVRGTDVVLG